MASQVDTSPELASLMAQTAVDLHGFVDSLARTAQVFSEVAQYLRDRGNGENAGSGDAESETVDEGTDDDALGTGDQLPTKTASKSRSVPNASEGSPGSNQLLEFRGTLASSGRYYVVLEEEFDALPLVATYASSSRQTICYTAIHDSIVYWWIILEAILKDSRLRVLAPTKKKIGRLAQALEALTVASTPWVVLLAFRFLGREAFGDHPPGCVIFWGLPPGQKFHELRKTVEQTRHTCIILTKDEYARPGIRQTLMSLSVTEHPHSSLFNNGSEGLLSSVRLSLRRVLFEPQYQAHICRLYESFLTHHRIGQTRPKPLELAQQANNFAAKVLLHGRAEDGSLRFKPDGQRLEVSAAIINQLGLEEAVRDGLLLQQGVFEGPDGPSPASANTLTTRPSSSHSYIVLEEDFDVIPLIGYLADKHSKTICFISHQKSVSPYKAIFREITSKQIIRPGKKKSSMAKGIQKFINSESSLLLLRGDIGTPHNIKGIAADAIIHWGLPSIGCFIGQIKSPKSTSSYLILPTDEKTAATNLVMCNKRVEAHPESVQLTAYGPKSPILPYRKKTRAALAEVKPLSLKKAYMNQLSRPAVSKLEAVRRANRFAARVLLHGESGDGSEVYKPIAPRLKVSRKAAYSRGLHVAIAQGLVHLDA